jgi:hypothetical protein
MRLLSAASGASNVRMSPTSIELRLYFELRASKPNVIFIPIVNIPAEIIVQELAQGHCPFSLKRASKN